MENVENLRDADPSLIFVHIPKTAGRTLSHILTRYYEEASICWSHKTHLKQIRRLPADEKRQIKLLYGHMPFGAHQMLPQPCRYFTMMRDPVERVISHYSFILQSPTHARYPVAKAAKSIKEYVSCGLHPQTDNGQTRSLSGVSGRVGFGECTREHLELAKHNLREHFLLVGTSEKFDETVLILSKLMGWATPYYPRLNVSQNRPHQESLSRDELVTIRRFNALDLELYHYANELLDEQVKAQGSTFADEVKEFQRINAEKYAEVNYKVDPLAALETSLATEQTATSKPALPTSEVNRLRLELTQAQEQLSQYQRKVELLERQQSVSLSVLGRAISFLSKLYLSRLWWWTIRLKKLKNRWSGSYSQLKQLEHEDNALDP
ncbi:MAG: sulfotransferase family 2 domain-containing protein [Elainellaceae cyanobacterium]